MKKIFLSILIIFLFTNSYASPSKREIKEWEELKTSRIESKVCQIMKNEVSINETHRMNCSDSFSNIVIRAKKSASELNTWFDALGIPEKFRSFDEIKISKDTLYCVHTIRKWDQCPKQSISR
jgi:hypothetical protein